MNLVVVASVFAVVVSSPEQMKSTQRNEFELDAIIKLKTLKI